MSDWIIVSVVVAVAIVFRRHRIVLTLAILALGSVAVIVAHGQAYSVARQTSSGRGGYMDAVNVVAHYRPILVSTYVGLTVLGLVAVFTGSARKQSDQR